MHSIGTPDDDLLRVVAALRKQLPDIVIHVRADAGFGLPRMYEVCEQNHLTYTFGFSTNARLKTLTEELMKQAVDGYQQTKEKQRLFDCFDYQCDSWDRTRRVIAKAECHDRGEPTSASRSPTARAFYPPPTATACEYDHYTQAGESEQRMDELKNGLSMDRLSCPPLHGQLLPAAVAHWPP